MGWAEESILERGWELPPLLPMRAEQGIWGLPEAEEAQACCGRSSLQSLWCRKAAGRGPTLLPGVLTGLLQGSSGELELEPTTARVRP